MILERPSVKHVATRLHETLRAKVLREPTTTIPGTGKWTPKDPFIPSATGWVDHFPQLMLESIRIAEERPFFHDATFTWGDGVMYQIRGRRLRMIQPRGGMGMKQAAEYDALGQHTFAVLLQKLQRQNGGPIDYFINGDVYDRVRRVEEFLRSGQTHIIDQGRDFDYNPRSGDFSPRGISKEEVSSQVAALIATSQALIACYPELRQRYSGPSSV